MTQRLRADLLLLQRGLFDSRAKAQAAIAAGLVRADGAVVAKASVELPTNARIEAESPHPYVSRGGIKLAAALEAFCIDPKGKRCLDVGSSTGGFTDVLLRRGAATVTAIDTGRDQFHAKLRRDRRVTLHEGTDVRHFAEVGGAANSFNLAVIDVSFISLTLILPGVTQLLHQEGTIVALIKPQFEAGRAHVGRGGIVKNEAVQALCVARVREALTMLGFSVGEAMESPIAGGDGNREFLIAARRIAS